MKVVIKLLVLTIMLLTFITVVNGLCLAYSPEPQNLSQSGGGRWAYKGNIEVVEPIGLKRVNEPVELTLSLDVSKPQGDDIRITDENGIEIPCQVNEVGSKTFNICFFAQADPNSRKTYRIYFGNPSATKPNYGALPCILDNQAKLWQTNGVLIKWDGLASYKTSGTNLITMLKFDSNADNNPASDFDCLNDEHVWDSYYGYLGSNISLYPTGFGFDQAQVVENGPIYCEVGLGPARVRYYKDQKWIKVNQYIDSMLSFDRYFQFMKNGLGDEVFVPNWGPSHIDAWLTCYDRADINPGYLAFRNPNNGLIFGAVAQGVPRWFISAKYSGAWDRDITFDTSSSNQDARIYWYSDTSNNYSGIEQFSKQALNPLRVKAVIDTDPPITDIKVTPDKPDGSNNWYVSQPEIKLSINEAGTTYYQLDNSIELAYSKPIMLSEGKHKLTYYSVDSFGNVEAEKVVEFNIDSSAPTKPSITAPTDGILTNNQNPALSWDSSTDTISGLSHYDLYIDGKIAISDITATATSTAAPELCDGSHSWCVRAYDTAGNYADSGTFTVAVDATPPETRALTEPENPNGQNGWYAIEPAVTLSTNESSTSYYHIDSDAYRVYESTITIPEGIHTLYYYSVDTANNKEKEHAMEVKIDSGLPTVTANLSQSHISSCYLKEETITFSFDATDPISGIALAVAEVNGTPITNGEQLRFDEPGEHTFTVTAVDEAGNQASKTMTFMVGYEFSWLPPIKNKCDAQPKPQTFNRKSTIPIKFAVFDGAGNFISDASVKIIVSDGTHSETFAYGDGNGCIKINPDDKQYLLNVHLQNYPWYKSADTITVSVYFGGNDKDLGMLQEQTVLILK